MALAAGEKLGPYEILSPLGAGGMGAVYRARDTRLGRDVAIKICSAQFTDRFEREAHAVAAVNHPNICHLYDVGALPSGAGYLVMELIEGQTLTERIRQGPVPLEEALRIAAQIGDALEAAHEKHITHRDLKPGNVMLTSEGPVGSVVKVLDFGLAKQERDPGKASSANDPANSPTLTIAATEAGMILGTAAYMSPEQAKGKQVDKRADIWAFGVVLYEMLTGERPFHGEDAGDILASVIKDQPNFEKLPAKVRPLIESCLEKDPKKRLRDIGDAWRLLDHAAGTAGGAGSQPAAVSRTARPVGWMAAAGVLALAVLGVGFLHFRERPPAVLPMHLSITLPEGVTPGHFALSPDGRTLVFNNRTQLWIRSMDSPDIRLLSGTDGSRIPFWSADSRTIGFFADGKLKTIPAAGGPSRTLCSDTGLGEGGTWNAKGTILYATEAGALYRVPAAGGTCIPLTKAGHADDARIPTFLPDGVHFLYSKGAFTGDESTRGLYVASLDAPIGRRLLADVSSAVFVPSAPGGNQERLLFLRETNLMAQPFDAGSAQFTGDAVALAQQVTFSNTPPQIAASASDTGTVVYLANGRPESQLTWVDRSGKKIGNVGQPARDFTGITLSPDGKQIAFVRSTPTGEDNLWLRELERNTETRLTSPPLVPRSPVWSRDGQRVAFGAGDAIYIKDAAGGGQESELERGHGMPSDISRDGRWLVFTDRDPKTAGDIWLLPDPLVSAANHKPAPFLRTPFNESQGQISPDGKWLAYTSNESGTDEVYMRPFPAGDGKWQISTGMRDTEPRWRADGRELFYKETLLGSLRTHKLLAVTVGLAAAPLIGAPKELFEFDGGGFVTQLNAFMYSPSPDGQRFVIKAYATDALPTLNVLLNWQAALKK